LNIEYQCLVKVKGSSKQIYIIPDGTTDFFSNIKVDMIMCSEKFYKRHKAALDAVMKKEGKLTFI